MVAPSQQCLASRGTERGGVETVVGEPFGGKAFGNGRAAGPAEGARGPKAGVVQQDDQDVGCPLGRTQRLDRRKRGVGILGRTLKSTPLVGGAEPIRSLPHGRWRIAPIPAVP